MKQRAIDERMEKHGYGSAESAASDQGEATPGPSRGRRNDGVVHQYMQARKTPWKGTSLYPPSCEESCGEWRHNHGEREMPRLLHIPLRHVICMHLRPLFCSA
jgi:hypothetical protein